MSRVVVVGAGLSGLCAAHALRRRDIDVDLLEASPRVGGRIRDARAATGHVFPLGAEWLGPDEERLGALLTDFGLATSAQHVEGRALIEVGGERAAYAIDESGPLHFLPLPATDAGKAVRDAFAELDADCDRVPLDAPWTTPDAERLDRMPLHDWMLDRLHDAPARALFAAAAGVEVGTRLDRISLLYYLFLRRAINRRIVDDRRIIGGTERLVQRLAEPLVQHITCDARVDAIEQTATGVTVHAAGAGYAADRVIVTAPPAAARRIEWRPALPPDRAALLQAITLSAVVKVIVVYETPFWRERGLSGHSLSDVGPLQTTDDASPADGAGALVGFVRDRHAERWHARPTADRRVAIVEQLVRLFGARAAPAGHPRTRLGRRAAGGGRLLPQHATGRADPLGPGHAPPPRPGPLGRHRAGRPLDGLDGGRDPLWRAAAAEVVRSLEVTR